jgi:hypothetical protein
VRLTIHFFEDPFYRTQGTVFPSLEPSTQDLALLPLCLIYRHQRLRFLFLLDLGGLPPDPD